MLKQLRDPHLLEWWARNAGGWRTKYPAEVGRKVVALLGAFQLDSVGAVIREQKRLPLSQRRGVLFVVDAMQTISRVEFESALPELGRYVASLCVAMQSLSNLEALSPTMRDTLLDNGGCPTVFQVAGSDACDLLWELGADDSPRTTSSGTVEPLLLPRLGRDGTAAGILYGRAQARVRRP